MSVRRKVGVEEEFHLVDARTRRLTPRAQELLARLPEDRFVAELQRCVVEVNGSVVDDMTALHTDLVTDRRLLVDTAADLGVGVAAAGAMPLAVPTELEVTGSPRFRHMLDEYQLLARDQLICGTQVHVELPDRDEAVRVAGRVVPYLPIFLALSASSPFWADGTDTGYASGRALVWPRWPSTGPAAQVTTASEYDALIDGLISSGVISDPGMVYFDVRPSAHRPTLELRVCDSCPHVESVALIAALFRALVDREVAAVRAGEPPPTVAPTLARAALWRAARSGLEDGLVDVDRAVPRPATDLVGEFVDRLRPHLEDTDDWDTVTDLCARALRDGSSAERQRRALRRRGRLTDVVDLLVAETADRSLAVPVEPPAAVEPVRGEPTTAHRHHHRAGTFRPGVVGDTTGLTDTQLVGWRRDLHEHPELSFEERRSTTLVADHLRALGLTPVLLPGGTGLWCDLGPATPQCVALRADLDALPVPEATGLPYASTVPGVSHACGHDAHTAMLLGAATVLAAAPPPQRVRLVFQPAEETTPGGSVDTIAAGVLDGVAKIFALHCDPHLQVGRLATRTGPITSSNDAVTVRLWSAGGHTARPHLTGDLIHAAAVLVTGMASVLDRRLDARTATVLTWGRMAAGQAGNSVPESGELVGTLRSASRDTWASLEPLVTRTIGQLLAPYDVRHELSYRQGVPPVVNDPDCTEDLREAIGAVVGDDHLVEASQSSGGEDFAWYLEQVPGAMARLGVWDGTSPREDLHQPAFTLDERALMLGVRTFVALAHSGLG
ncbi:glutamate--cysteine ligase [Prescottella subtropica]|uniref:glutamate--cysteine ligase n=1 Tax=Prescottella subtropica TaxID=2545757 RepID=UPI001F4FA83E|nr:glutamate--cysteine ligase [Prescottella subtropica]